MSLFHPRYDIRNASLDGLELAEAKGLEGEEAEDLEKYVMIN